MNKEIGGYFSLELRDEGEYHTNAIRLNTARSALQYILRAKKYKKIYLPYYICECVLQPIITENIEYEYYHINKQFEPIFEKDIWEDECFLYVNYFGVNDHNVIKVAGKYSNVIIDNSQAFYSQPLMGIDTFYSARKFFGVSDGAYLYTDTILPDTFEQDVSYNRMEHLLKRIDISANEGYSLFLQNECDLNNSGIKKMSQLSHAILKSINYDACRKQRLENYQYLCNKLGKLNMINLPPIGNQVPMVYPFITNESGLREALIKNKIYVATYWTDVLKHVLLDSFEVACMQRLLAIPLDQRYTTADMDCICENIFEYLRLEKN